jgi:ankyrin repeat protein
MKATLCASLAALVVHLFLAPGPSENRALVDAIHADDAAAIATQLAAGADANAPDATGATPLMHSAVYSSLPAMRLLLDAHAEVNAANTAGSTALMWAVHDTQKVRLLLERGAGVGTKTSNGVTALLVAVRESNVDAVRALLAAGADPAALTPTQVARAIYERDPSGRMRQTLAAAGARFPTSDDLSAWARGGVGGLQEFRTFARLVMDGARPDTTVQTTTLTAPAFSLIAHDGDVAVVRTVLDRVVDANVRASNGATALMFAAFSSRTSAELMEALLAKGADPTLRDANGRTALDWALTRGETPVAKVLRAAGTSASAPPPAPHAIERPRAARAAIAIALERLEPAERGFFNHTKCISCHNQSLPLMAAARASARGVDAGAVAANAQVGMGAWRHAGGRNYVSEYQFFGYAPAPVGAPDGPPDGTLLKVSATIRLNAAGTAFTGSQTANVVDFNGNVFAQVCGTRTATRLQ